MILRYIEEDSPVATFVKFVDNQGHKTAIMFNGLKEGLKEIIVCIKHCCGQSCDNASSISEKCHGVQVVVGKENNLAIWIPCIEDLLQLTWENVWDELIASTYYFICL